MTSKITSIDNFVLTPFLLLSEITVLKREMVLHFNQQPGIPDLALNN